MIGYIIFSVLAIFALAYYFAFENFCYKAAKTIAEGLGGSAVFRLGRSYMRRYYDGVEERVWVAPKDQRALVDTDFTAWFPSPGKLFLQRKRDPGFRFDIEPKTGILSRTLSLGALKEAVFHVPQLDETLRLRTNNSAEAARYFSDSEKQKALIALFHAGFKSLKGDGSIIAAMHGVSEKDINADSIGRYLQYLRSI
jgi:hypothetical protein